MGYSVAVAAVWSFGSEYDRTKALELVNTTDSSLKHFNFQKREKGGILSLVGDTDVRNFYDFIQNCEVDFESINDELEHESRLEMLASGEEPGDVEEYNWGSGPESLFTWWVETGLNLEWKRETVNDAIEDYSI